jgi:uncharacterized protein (TIGR00369 family)
MTLTPSGGLRDGWGVEKSRTVTWRDPAATAALGASMDGLEFVQAVRDHQLPPPPIEKLMQIELVSVVPGEAVFKCKPDDSAYNAVGAVCGGLVCTMLDTAVGCALHSTMPRGKGFTSIEIKVNFLKTVRQSSGVLTATGIVIKAGSRVAFTEGTVTDASGVLVATASSTLLVVDLPTHGSNFSAPKSEVS